MRTSGGCLYSKSLTFNINQLHYGRNLSYNQAIAPPWSLIETRRVDGMSLRDGLLLLLQAENEQRNENRNERLLKRARFRYQATIMETQFDVTRGLDKNRVMELATCRYIKSGIPVIITGPHRSCWYG